jgi:hypothetical protein
MEVKLVLLPYILSPVARAVKADGFREKLAPSLDRIAEEGTL